MDNPILLGLALKMYGAMLLYYKDRVVNGEVELRWRQLDMELRRVCGDTGAYADVITQAREMLGIAWCTACGTVLDQHVCPHNQDNTEEA